jgi:TetR/AcrR family transcriptional repressor of nem operon
MGRKKSYDREELIGKAMEIFRDHGFANTSAQMLVDGLGVNRFGIYAEFGNKQGLFDAALERYNDEVIERRFRPLEEDGAGLDNIRELFQFYGAAGKGAAAGRGCLLCNTAVELGPLDPSGAGFVDRYFKRLSRAFHAALKSAHDNGELRPSVSLRDEASFLTATLLGLFVMIRANAPASVTKRAAGVAIEHVDGLRSAGDALRSPPRR